MLENVLYCCSSHLRTSFRPHSLSTIVSLLLWFILLAFDSSVFWIYKNAYNLFVIIQLYSGNKKWTVKLVLVLIFIDATFIFDYFWRIARQDDWTKQSPTLMVGEKQQNRTNIFRTWNIINKKTRKRNLPFFLKGKNNQFSILTPRCTLWSRSRIQHASKAY